MQLWETVKYFDITLRTYNIPVDKCNHESKTLKHHYFDKYKK